MNTLSNKKDIAKHIGELRGEIKDLQRQLVCLAVDDILNSGLIDKWNISAIYTMNNKIKICTKEDIYDGTFDEVDKFNDDFYNLLNDYSINLEWYEEKFKGDEYYKDPCLSLTRVY